MNRSAIFLAILFLFSPIQASILFYDGVGGLKCGDGGGVSLEKSWTLTAWVYPQLDAIGGPYFIAGRTNGDVAAPYAMRLESDPGLSGYYTVSCEILDAGGSFTKVYADCSFGDCIRPGAGFYHIGCHYSSEAMVLTPYINGVAFPGTTPPSEMDTTGYEITIGATDGQIEICDYVEVTDVVLYDFEINTEYINLMYKSRMRNNVVPTNNRYGYWPLDDLLDSTHIAGETFFDRSGRGNTCIPITDGIGTAYADFLRYQ